MKLMPFLLNFKTVSLLLLLQGSKTQSSTVYNGLAATPPMGWISWTRFKCEINCDAKPFECINEQLFIDTANRLVEDGYMEAGYTRLNLDDCWSAMQRSAKGELSADRRRFPHGIAWLAEYAHKRGLKLGIYANYGDKTCMGFPGSKGHLKQDAMTFASWGIDMLKMDGCFSNTNEFDSAYPEMATYLNATGRDIVFSCSWPFYQLAVGRKPDYNAISKYCNLWRNYDDIDSRWNSILRVINYYEEHQSLVIGNPGLTVYQARTQMALWCLWSAPLFMSNDLRNIRPEFKNILLNRDLIAVDQDPLGIMGRRIHVE
ncbi:unnamed protein product [Soboliphyme baturini]|uniref:Alpha-galactosidase n=1 Tax=Soboliphyme baturini TaxID=241478 RepID=A0A183IMZ0_9BILA|nr:unnamed protein product [Soboliphyme baturini]